MTQRCGWAVSDLRNQRVADTAAGIARTGGGPWPRAIIPHAHCRNGDRENWRCALWIYIGR